MLRTLPLLLLAGCLHAQIPRVPASNAHVLAEARVEVRATVEAGDRGPKPGDARGRTGIAPTTGEVSFALDEAEAALLEADGVLDAGLAAADDALHLLDGVLVAGLSGGVSASGFGAVGGDGSVDRDAPRGNAAELDGTREAELDGMREAELDGARDAGLDDSCDAELDTLDVAEEHERLADHDRGIRSTNGTRSTARLEGLLTTEGLEVDGFRTRLADLEPLAQTRAEAHGATTLRVGGSVRVSSNLELDPQSPDEGRLVVRVAGEEPAEVRARVRVHLVIDRSSSMQRSWGDVLAAARTLVGRLDPRDEIHVVAYDARAEEVHPLGPVGDGRAVLRALARISVGGGTNIEAGLGMAYRTARQAPTGLPSRVILLSDGVPNGGAYTAAELAPMAARAGATGCLTTTIGLGDSFDADVLRAVARAGSGGYHVALDPSGLAPSLEAELSEARRTAAALVRVRLSLGDGLALAEGEPSSALMPEVRGLAAGEERRFVVRVRVRSQSSARVRVRVRVAQGGRTRSAEGSVDARRGIATARVAADLDLSAALDAAADHLNNGRAAQAAAALLAHADRYAAHRGDARLRVRLGAVRRFAEAARVLTPRASHTERRRVALAMGALASRLCR